MLKLNLTHLLASVQESPSFEFPEMNDGTRYLFKNIYCRISSGESVLLSDLDYDAFDNDDISSLQNLYSTVFRENGYRINCITKAVKRAIPTCKTTAYI